MSQRLDCVPLRTLAFALTFAGLVRGAAAAEPAPAAPAPLVVGWQQALDRALARNPSAVVARQEIARADALVREARAGWLPVLAGNGSLVHLDATRYLAGAVVTPQNTWNGNIQLTVPILAPTSWANDWHAQDARNTATVNAADVRRQIAAAVGRTYLTVVLQHRQLEVAVSARDTAKAHYDYAHTRLQGGLGNSIDDARAEQELRSDEAAVGAVQAALVRAQSALAILLSEDRPVDARDEIDLATSPDAVDGSIQKARDARTDVQALKAKLVASEHLRRDDWVYYAPSLIGVGQAYEETKTALQPEHGWQAQLVLSIPLYDGGYRYGIARERKALETEARVQWEAALRQVSVEIRSAFEVAQRTDESLLAAQRSAQAATTAAKLADQAYRAGATTNLELIDAERRARDAGLAAALAEDAAREARLDLLLAAGRFP